MRIETDRHPLTFPMALPPAYCIISPTPVMKPCHGCAVDSLVNLGCYGALFLLEGNAFRPGDRLMFEGFKDLTRGRDETVTAEVVRCDGRAVVVAFDQELPDSLELRPPLRVVRLLPVCPLD